MNADDIVNNLLGGPDDDADVAGYLRKLTPGNIPDAQNAELTKRGFTAPRYYDNDNIEWQNLVGGRLYFVTRQGDSWTISDNRGWKFGPANLNAVLAEFDFKANLRRQ